ncbi:MAG TPA: isoprenylcysteine carboxylmethyltransferase family protein [Aeromicrobium sp.]|nr:isoprenylcysteine carboxylmethyltransferase family protein [Aeromicrobium sp.]
MTDSDTSTGITVPPPLIFVGGFLIGLAVEWVFPVSAPPVPVRIAVGLAGLAGFLYFDTSAMRGFGRAGTSVLPFGDRTTTIVTDGPYRFSRNPMYVGMTLLYIGVAASTGVMWAFATLPIVLVVIRFHVIAREEAYLSAKFGDSYREYQSRVRRWI